MKYCPVPPLAPKTSIFFISEILLLIILKMRWQRYEKKAVSLPNQIFTTMSKKILIATGGGDCPGLNAVIRGIVKSAAQEEGWQVSSIIEGVRMRFLPSSTQLQNITSKQYMNRCAIEATNVKKVMTDEHDKKYYELTPISKFLADLREPEEP